MPGPDYESDRKAHEQIAEHLGVDMETDADAKARRDETVQEEIARKMEELTNGEVPLIPGGGTGPFRMSADRIAAGDFEIEHGTADVDLCAATKLRALADDLAHDPKRMMDKAMIVTLTHLFRSGYDSRENADVIAKAVDLTAEKVRGYWHSYSELSTRKVRALFDAHVEAESRKQTVQLLADNEDLRKGL